MNTLYTIGYGGRPPGELVELLQRWKVATVVDVRLRPDRASMGAYSKAKTEEKGIQKLLGDAGIAYVWLVELGNVFLDREDWLQRYGELMQRAGDLLTERLVAIPDSICLLCAEKRVTDCHRKVITDYLARQGWNVEHIE